MGNDDTTALTKISGQLAQLVKLTAQSLTADRKQREQILLLSRAGLDRHEIAEILGTTPGTVSVELSVLKKTKKQRK
jgi:DNA-binding NarL/FixJ family response regulator